MDNPLLIVKQDKGAFVSQSFFDSYPIKVSAPQAVGTLLQSTFSVNPTNPYFLCFAGAGGGIMLQTQFEFLLGGSVVSSCYYFWGSIQASLLNSAVIWYRSNATTVCIFDPIANADTYPYGERWTSVCDTVRVTTTNLDGVNNATVGSYVHGILQQPWS